MRGCELVVFSSQYFQLERFYEYGNEFIKCAEFFYDYLLKKDAVLLLAVSRMCKISKNAEYSLSPHHVDNFFCALKYFCLTPTEEIRCSIVK